MKRLIVVLIAAVAVALPAAAAQGAAPAQAARGAKLTIERTSLGKILATGRGFTVYMFTHDSLNHDTCVTIPGCTGLWPLITTSGKPTLGPGVKRSLVGTIKAGGARQVTYAGHPLYTYVSDSGAGDTSYVGQSQFGGRWYALSPAGRIVK